MNRIFNTCVFAFSMIASVPCAALELPPATSVHNATVSCYGERIVISKSATSDLLLFLDSVKDGWSSIGFTTHPAGDIQILLTLQDAKEIWFYTWNDHHLVGTYSEKRKLSQTEAEQLNQLLPSECIKSNSKKP